MGRKLQEGGLDYLSSCIASCLDYRLYASCGHYKYLVMYLWLEDGSTVGALTYGACPDFHSY
jgi:hypothetical protein